MSLDITNLLSSLKNYYNSQNSAGNKYTGTDEDMSRLAASYGANASNTITLTRDGEGKITRTIVENGVRITVSAEKETSFSYIVDAESGKITIFGNNLTITIDEGNRDLIEVVGISNEIQGTSSKDNIAIYGFDNKVDAKENDDKLSIYGGDNIVDSGDGTDEIEILGDFNTLINSEKNIFKGVGGQYLIYGDNEFLVSKNPDAEIDEDENTEIEVEYESILENISFKGDNLKIISTKDTSDEISLTGDNNYIDTSAGADEISVKGSNNIITTGVDDTIDTVTIDGENNQVVGGKEDYVYHTSVSDTITITPGDESQHYISLRDSKGKVHEILIQSNAPIGTTVEISYEINEDDEIIFKGDNAKIISQGEGNAADEKIIIEGKNNYVDASVGNDEITVNGDNNIIVTGEGSNVVTLNGNENQVEGSLFDEVYHTSESGKVILPSTDQSVHYIKFGDINYLIQRNEIEGTTENIDITFTYNLSGKTFEFIGDCFKITQLNDNIKDNIKVTGSYNCIDTGAEDDEIEVTGNHNIIHAGDGDDAIIVTGDNNEIYGDAGDDGVAVYGNDNIIDGYEYEDQVFTLNSSNVVERINIGDKTYEVQLTNKAQSAGDVETKLIVRARGDVVTFQADNVTIYAGSGQEDNIKFFGKNSYIFAGDKNDNITVIGDNNYVDGWTGDDKILLRGIKNQAYGFLGDDEIIVEQREFTDDEIIEEALTVDEKDENGNDRTEEEIIKIAVDNLKNYVDGEFDTDKVDAPKDAKISINTEIYKSNANTITLDVSDDEKKIEFDGKVYTIRNYASFKNNNPFVKARKISYEIADVEVTDMNGNKTTQKQLIITGDYISVTADDGQQDNVKIIGSGSYVDLGDEDDVLEVEGDKNLLFGNIGSDLIKVTGSGNEIYADKEGRMSSNDNDVIVVEGDDNSISGGIGKNDTLFVNGKNLVWKDIEYVIGNYGSRYSLSDDEREVTLNVAEGKTYTIKANVSEEEKFGTLPFTYEYDEESGVLKISGDKLQVIANAGQADNIEFLGKDCVINLGDGNDIIDASGSRNTIYGGSGNDTIKIFGNSFNVFAQAGNDKIISNVVNSVIDGGDGNDNLDISNQSGANNTIRNIEKTNTNPKEGLIVLSPQNLKGEITCNINGEKVTFVVQPNNIIYPQELAGEIFVKYYLEEVEITDKNGNEKTTYKLVVEGDGIIVAPKETTKTTTDIYAKIIGSNIRLETSSGNDVVEVEGNNNTIVTHEGENNVTIEGNNNEVQGGAGREIFAVVGNNNTIYGGGGDDIVGFEGDDNTFKTASEGTTTQGSLVLTQESGKQKIVLNVNGKKRIYRLSLYGIDKADLDTTHINVEYYIDKNGYTVFEADNVKIEVLDNEYTLETDKVTTDNADNIKLIGDNCYVKTTYGGDSLIIVGNNNIADGWYGDDSFEILGDNNEVRGFYGNDTFNINGNDNFVDGEQGIDTLTVLNGTGNTYNNIEKIRKNNPA